MACARCGQQRRAVANAIKSGSVTQTVKEVARGAGMMTGILPKDSLPGPGTKR